ncbi:MAG TPA: hypothetical protein V6C81_07365 [Planktothrix sp.]|jgi:hypothetical protein
MFKQVSVAIASVLLLSACSQKSSEPPAQKPVEQQPSAERPMPTAKAYTATFSSNGPFQKSVYYSDGAGHVRMDVNGTGKAPSIVLLLDLNKNETTMWVVGSGKFFRRHAEPNDPLVLQQKVAKGQTSNLDPLGAKTIDGHKCHGWKNRIMGNEAWVDDEYGCIVQSQSRTVQTKLKSLAPGAPAPTLFQPPAGYVQKALPTASLRSSRGK